MPTTLAANDVIAASSQKTVPWLVVDVLKTPQPPPPRPTHTHTLDRETK